MVRGAGAIICAMILWCDLAISGGFGPYFAEVLGVYDGDTFTSEVRVWPGQINRVRVRIDGIDAPEMRARDALRRMLAGGKVRLVNVRRGKYAGRMLAGVRVGGMDVGTEMIRRGLARPYHGGRRLPWCH